MSESCNMQGILFGLGNPLLDISAEVTTEFLQRYGLKANDQILAEDKHKTLFQDMVAEFSVDYIPGGATQNAIRIAQWLIGIPYATTFMGCIGKDRFGEILEEKVHEAGVKSAYKYVDNEPTGTCAVCITEKHRSLVAYLGAANSFTIDHVNLPENQKLICKAKYFYMAGYPLTVCPDAMLKIAEFATLNDRLVAMNLSAPFLCTFFQEPMLKMLPHADILFGNEAEMQAFSDANDLHLTDIKQIAIRIARWPKQNGIRGRIVIVTQGHDPTIVVKDGSIIEFPVTEICPCDIVDTNGAGDAFVGGYLARLINGCPLECCIAAGHYAANYIIRQSGIQLNDQPTFRCICCK